MGLPPHGMTLALDVYLTCRTTALDDYHLRLPHGITTTWDDYHIGLLPNGRPPHGMTTTYDEYRITCDDIVCDPPVCCVSRPQFLFLRENLSISLLVFSNLNTSTVKQ